MTILACLAWLACHAPAPTLAPPPKDAVRHVHHFYDRPAKIELAAVVSLAATDASITCIELGQKYGHETYLPTQSCRGVALWLGGEVLAQEGLAYALHRLHLHKIERVARAWTIQANTTGIWYSTHH